MHNLSLEYLPIFEKAVQQSDSVVFAYAINENRFIYLNAGFENLWNMKRDLINPNNLIDTIDKEDQEYLIQGYREILQGKEKSELEFRLNSNGQTRWMKTTIHLVKDEVKGSVLVGFSEDITHWKENEAKTQKYAAKKDSVLEILSHDLANPLNSIQGLSSLILEELKGHDLPEVNKLIELIKKTSERSVMMIREFVKQEFLESKNAMFAKERVDLVKKMKEIIDQYQESEKEISKTFLLKTNQDSIFIHIDAYKFSQIINNLISNSIKFTNDDGHIELILEEKKDMVLITLADNGIGIPEKYHADLFDKFTPARRRGLKGEPSTGLGMSIIKTIVEWHGGEIWFESEEGKGTIFYMLIPKF